MRPAGMGWELNWAPRRIGPVSAPGVVCSGLSGRAAGRYLFSRVTRGRGGIRAWGDGFGLYPGLSSGRGTSR